jgi:hypothetical protein
MAAVVMMNITSVARLCIVGYNLILPMIAVASPRNGPVCRFAEIMMPVAILGMAAAGMPGQLKLPQQFLL